MQKKVTDNGVIQTTDYLDGFQYNQSMLEFFPHAEGYVKVTAMGESPTNPNYVYNYVFNYTDHLGNVRVSYTKDPQTGNLKILDEAHYYPFGLKHQKYATLGLIESSNQVIIAPITNNPFKYAFNNKEFQNELSLNWYDYHARNYQPDLGRWTTIDPMAEKYESSSSYVYVINNPVLYLDMDGEDVYIMGEDGNMILARVDKGSKTDQLMDKNTGDMIANDIHKDILEGSSVNIAKNGLTVNGGYEMSNSVGNFLTSLSVYTQKEISWGDYKSENGNEIINILPYQNNKIDSSDPLSSFISHNNMEYELQYGNHTHPGFWRTNTVEQWVQKDAGTMQPSSPGSVSELVMV